MRRIFDITILLLFSPIIIFIIIIIAILIKITSKGSVLYFSDRVGRYNKIFSMPKFRSMKINTPQVATHLLVNSDSFLTPIGGFLRKYSLDELPQLWCIFTGNMTIIGPRPALFNQDDLITLRDEYNISKMTPGLTGWAQINGRDELSIKEKVDFEIYYLQHKSIWLDIKIMWLTIVKVISSKNITH